MKTLVIEDEIVCRLCLERMLEKHSIVSVAESGDRGLQMFRDALENNVRFDLIFLDIMLPGMNGLDVLRKVRQAEGCQEIHAADRVKVVMTTGLEDSGNILDAFRKHCDAYLIKPLKADEINETLIELGLVDKKNNKSNMPACGKQCELLDTCPFFQEKMEGMPKAELSLRKRFCLKDNTHCARYIVAKGAGRDAIPCDLYPSERKRAKEILLFETASQHQEI